MAARVPFVPAELHTTERPSSTAQWTTLGRALELGRDERIVTDFFAPLFLTRPSMAALRALRAGGPVVRQAERLDVAGLATSALCRHRFIDEHLTDALPGVEQVVILGAGYDTRAYRFAEEIGPRPVFEVDLAPLSRRKSRIVAANRDLFGPKSVTRVEIDFRTESLADRLRESGFAPGRPAFVAWEGVSMYLSRATLDDTLAALAGTCGPGSLLAMDYWQHVAGRYGAYRLRKLTTRVMTLIGEPITFAIRASQVDGLLGAHGFDVLDLAEAGEMAARYSTGGRPCDPGMYVVAARLG